MFLDPGESLLRNQRSGVGTGLEPVVDLHLPDLGGEPLGKVVIEADLHEEPIGADTGPAIVLVLGGSRPFYRSIEIGVVEDDERLIASKFQIQRHHVAGARRSREA